VANSRNNTNAQKHANSGLCVASKANRRWNVAIRHLAHIGRGAISPPFPHSGHFRVNTKNDPKQDSLWNYQQMSRRSEASHG